MSQGVIATIPKFQFSANGVPMVGGSLTAYIAGTTTPATTWQDSALSIANTNPVTLDARGECVLWLDPSVVYKFILKNALGVIQWTQDNVSSPAALRLDLSGPNGASLIGWLRNATGAVASTLAKWLQRQPPSAFDFMTDAQVADVQARTLTLDVTAALQAACVAADAARSALVVPPGAYRISAAIVPPKAGILGAGQSATEIVCNGCSAFVFPAAMGLSRAACTIEKLGIRSMGNSCDGLYAFSAPGVAASAAPVYNSGITIRDIAIGNSGRFGGGFSLKDCFEVNVENIICTDVGCVVQLIGSVVQSTFRNISAFGDSAPTVLPRYGFSTAAAVYSAGTMTPEHITTHDCSFIRYTRGINHDAGLMVGFYDTDVETFAIGARLNAPCTMRGGIIAPAPASAGTLAWTGILREVYDVDAANGTILDDVEINALNMPGTPGASFGLDIGNNVSPVTGMVVKSLRIRGVAGSFLNAIRARSQGGDLSIENCVISPAVASGQTMDLQSQARAVIRGNRLVANNSTLGTITLSDAGNGAAYGEISNNQIGSLTLSLTSRGNWAVSNNDIATPSLHVTTALYGSAVWSPTIAAGANMATTLTVSGAAVGDPVAVSHTGLTSDQFTLTGFVYSAGNVRVVLKSDSGTSNTLTGTVKAMVFKV